MLLCPDFSTKQRPSKSSSADAAAADDDDGNLESKSDCTIIFPAARAWRVGEKSGRDLGCRTRDFGIKDRTCRVLISRSPNNANAESMTKYWAGQDRLLVTGCGLGRSAGIFPSQIDPNNAVSIAIVLSPRGVTIAELLPWEAAPPPFRRTTERIPVRILDQFGPRQLTHALNHKLRQSTQRRGPINARHPLNERNAMQTFK